MSERHVVIVDIKMPFWSIVGLMVKWALAAIPAGLILTIVYAVIVAIFGRVGGFIPGPSF